jgi:hypothetical protein
VSDPEDIPPEDDREPGGMEMDQGGAGRPPVERLWDDDAFRARVAELSQARGISVREALLAAGTSSKYMDPAIGGRNTNLVMRLAKFFDVHPAYLMFGPVVVTGPESMSKQPNYRDILPIAGAQLAGATWEQRLGLCAQIISSHWLQSALDPRSPCVSAEGTVRQIVAITR